MNKHVLKTHKPFNSRIEKKVLIGGETDYCAERLGYIKGINGISPALTFKQTPTLIIIANIHMTQCMATGAKAVFAASDGKLYTWKYLTASRHVADGTISEVYPSVHSVIVDGEYYSALVGGNKIALTSSDKKSQVYTIPVQLASSVMHCGRLFGVDLTDGYLLRWSGYSLLNWVEGVDGAGYVKLNPGLGKLLTLHVLGEKIVIVREKGITTISTLGDSRHMRMDVCDKHALPPVYADSSVICRGQLWIYTQNGMYVYDGSTLSVAPFERIMSDYVLSHPRVVEDRYVYYRALKDGVKYLFMYDTETGAGNPFGKNAYCCFFCEDKGYAFRNNVLGSLLPDLADPDRVWVSETFTYDADKPAVLKSLNIEGSGDFTVETDCDGRKLYAEGAGKYRYSESGQSFTFKVTGIGSITSMSAEWEVHK